MSTRVAVWSVAALGLFVLALATTPPFRSTGTGVALAVAGMALELSSRRSRSGGFLSLAGPCYLAAASLAGLGPAFAAMLATVSLTARTFLRSGPPQPVQRLAEALCDLVPALAAGVAAGVLARWVPFGPWLGLATLEVYLPLALVLPGQLLGVQEAQRNWPLTVASAALAPLLSLLAISGLWNLLWAVPAWLALDFSARLAERQTVLQDQELLCAELQQSRSGLARAEAFSGQLGRDLQRKAEELVLLRELARSLARSPELEETLELVFRSIQRLVGCRSVAFFQPGEAGLEVRSCRSPDGERLAGAELLELREPVVEQAWVENVTRSFADPPSSQARLFSGDPAGVAIPLEGLGVFYVGRQQPFSRDEQELLTLLTAQSGLALLAASRFESQQGDLELHARAHERLQGWVERLAALLEAARTVASTLDSSSLGARLLSQLAALVPHDACLVYSQTPALELTAGLFEPQRAPWHEVAAVVMENARPLLLDWTPDSRFPNLGQDSLLAVPLLLEGRPFGAVLLGAGGRSRFTRAHQDLLSVLAFQTAVALENSRLHQEVVEAYRLLQESQAQLVQSSKIAAVGQLAAGVAHELNTPLGAVVVGIESALRALDQPERARPRLERARGAAQRAEQIVSKLLYYTREGKKGHQAVDLNSVLVDTLEFLGYHLRLDKVQVDLLAGEIPRVLGNAHDLQQVVTNLLLNARDAVVEKPPEERRVCLRTLSRDGRVVVEVEDRGPGMEPAVLERVFEPFFTTKPVGRGTGLGLSVSQQIVEQHGGRLEAQSEPGRGSTFRVLLPVFSEGAA